MEQPHNEHLPMELSSQLVTMMTTEHYNLQTGRSMTIQEANGRSSLFVGAVSSGLVALAFVGQISQLGTAFFVFGLVILPTLWFMGLITFERVLQTGIADFAYAIGINRIRRLYLEAAPQLRPHLMFAGPVAEAEAQGRPAVRMSGWQIFLTMAGMVAVINSVLIGSFVGLLLAMFGLSLWAGTAAGVVALLVSVGLHQRYLRGQWMLALHKLHDAQPYQPLEATGS